MAVKTYFVKAGDFVKIGKSVDPVGRCEQIQAYCPLKLTILLLLEGDHEDTLYQKFTTDRLHGEWFNLSDAIKVFIEGFLPYEQDQPRLTASHPYHGGRGIPKSPEHRAKIAARWAEKRQAKSERSDLPKHSPIYKKQQG